MRTRTGSILAAVAVGAAGLVLTAASSSAATPTLNPSVTSVTVGGSLKVSPSGCDPIESEDDGSSYTYQQVEVVLTTGTGATERLAGVADPDENGDFTLAVPGWVDPAQPSTLAGRCVETTVDERSGRQSTRVVFTYPDVAIDVTPGPTSVPAPTLTLDRDTAAGGQVITGTVTGCQPESFVQVVLLKGSDLSGRFPFEFAGRGGPDEPQRSTDGTASVQLALNRPGFDIVSSGSSDGEGAGTEASGGPLPEGGYTALVVCASARGPVYIAEPQLVHVVGTNPSGAFRFEPGSDQSTYVASGEGCTGGRTVTVNLEVSVVDTDFVARAQHRSRALARGSWRYVARIDNEEEPEPITTTATATPAADGTWSVSLAVPDARFSGRVYADCGDPTVDGFRYVGRFAYDDNQADLHISRTSPTSSPTGGVVTVHAEGRCDEGVRFQFLDSSGTAVTAPSGTAPPVGSKPFQSFTATLAAPATPGSYLIAGTCGDEQGSPGSYDVFSPTTLAPTSPLPADPTTGWPSAGPRETYHGRIGPITLPAASPERATGAATQASTTLLGPSSGPGGPDSLGPSGLFIDVPRPDGDFAVNGIHVDLVDAQGNPVGPDRADFGYFIISNKSKANPACPESTFGLPGQIVTANGSGNSSLKIDDPYGIVVKGSDDWTGVYQLAGLADRSQQVYLSYDLDIRRDVDNVRPVATYFGSASGCSGQSWTIDGSGTPDVQSTYIPIAGDGVMIGTGANLGNGALYADMNNDRGRRLCRHELVTGGPGSGAAAGSGASIGSEPPTSYPDDPTIVDVTGCQVREQLSAGERLRFDAVYHNDRPRSAVMGIYEFFVWEGGGPAGPGVPSAPGALPLPGTAGYTG